MRAQMAKMQERLDQLESANAQPSSLPPAANAAAPPTPQDGTIQTKTPLPQGPTSPQVGRETSTYRQYSEDNLAAPRYDNVPTDPKYKGFFYLPGTQDMLKIGGYAKTDVMYDFKQAGNADSFVPSSIPLPQVEGVTNSNVSVRPTRLNLDFRVPTERFGDVRFYLEGDLLGPTLLRPACATPTDKRETC